MNQDEKSSSDKPAQELSDRSTLLRQLLASALSGSKSDLTDDEWSTLGSVARQCRDSALSDLDQATRVVEAYLRLRFTSLCENDEALNRVSRLIAEVVCGDPTARQRMTEFQNHLLEIKS